MNNRITIILTFCWHVRFSKDRTSDSHALSFLAISPVIHVHEIFYARLRSRDGTTRDVTLEERRMVYT